MLHIDVNTYRAGLNMLLFSIKELEVGTKDYTKYNFQNEVYSKSRLVLEVIKKFVLNNPEITFLKLVKTFPNELQSNTRIQFSDKRVVIMKIEDVTEKDQTRFYLKNEDIIFVADTAVVVCREWNWENIRGFIDRATSLGFDIEETT